jgi:hypothetical protein
VLEATSQSLPLKKEEDGCAGFVLTPSQQGFDIDLGSMGRCTNPPSPKA